MIALWVALKVYLWRRRQRKAVRPANWEGGDHAVPSFFQGTIPMCCGGHDPACTHHGHGAVVG